jgi:hypothetical protein
VLGGPTFLSRLGEMAGGSPGRGMDPPRGSAFEGMAGLVEPVEVLARGAEVGAHGRRTDPVERCQFRNKACPPDCGVVGQGLDGGVDADGGGAGDRLLVAVERPVVGDVLDGLGEIVGDSVDDAGAAGAGHGDVGEFAAAAFGEIVAAFGGGALFALHGEGVAVIEVFAVERRAPKGDPAADVGDYCEC